MTEIIKLPLPKTKGEISLEETIQRRKSVRQYQDKPLTLEQISRLLWSAQGITDKMGRRRAAPSAGATYPLEIYLVKSDGLFHYRPEDHTITKTQEGDLRPQLARAALGQSFIEEAPANIVIAAIYHRTTGWYGERGIRYVHIEVGHVAQNIHLQAIALGLGSVAVGAFQDNAVKQLLKLPKDQDPLYIIPVGYAKE